MMRLNEFSAATAPTRLARLFAALIVLASAAAQPGNCATMQSTSPTKKFAFNLFRKASEGSTDNVIVSPFSAYAALSMTLNGAGGNTRKEMAEVLGVPANDVGKLNERSRAVFDTLNKNDKVQMEVANAIYSDNSCRMKDTFMDICKKYYSAEAHSENFNDPQIVGKINGWCSEKTHGKIPTIIERLSPAEKIVLLNAIYFKGTWQSQFEPRQTLDDLFMSPKGELPVKMMHKRGKLMYMRGENFQSVSLPYVDGKQRLIVFLPDKDVELPAFQAQFTEDNWSKWMQKYASADVSLSLPKFKVDFFIQLNKALSDMGMRQAFSQSSADFSNMVNRDRMYISRVLQKTFMDVNEEGTEAAAVTAVIMAKRAVSLQQQRFVEFRVDRPFVIALVDDETDSILFLGSIVNPKRK